MMKYIARRVLQLIPILFGVTLLIFSLYTFFGEDPARIALGAHATPAKLESLRKTWGLDKPFLVQYGQFLKEIVTLDFGRSFVSGQRLSEMFSEGALVSLAVTLPAFVLGTLLNIAIAMLVVWYRGTVFEKAMSIIFTAAMSISYLVYVLFFQFVFAYKMDLFPIAGYLPGWSALAYLALPWIIQMVIMLGPDVRLYRTIFLDEVNADYVRTARAKGLSEGRVMFRHVLKNALIPVLTYTVIEVPFLIIGAFVVERFFGIPGIGDLLVTSVTSGDFPVIKGLTVMIAIAYALFNLLTDVLYAAVDPRVTLS
ncbi:MAG: ABC transporter permease [Proteobacteria bacterium]|nr:ABC transporter permease [Pseudomonadota bacterium]